MSYKTELYKLGRGDIARAAESLKSAFQKDPLWNRFFQQEADADRKLLAFFEIPIRHGVFFGEAYSVSEDLEGIGVLMPGGVNVYTFGRMLRSGAILPGLRMGGRLGAKLGQVFSGLTEDQKANTGGRDFLYVSILGVAQESQGQGYGGVLLRAFIEKSNESGLPLYLETETEENVRFYEKFGFRVVKEITLPVIELPMWEMLREPDSGPGLN